MLSRCVGDLLTITLIDPVCPFELEEKTLRGANSTVVLDLCSGSILSMAMYHFLRSQVALEY
jgi:hypothetical protein